jgi:hypothetical protein
VYGISMSFKDAMDSIFNQGEMRNKINKLNNEGILTN